MTLSTFLREAKKRKDQNYSYRRVELFEGTDGVSIKNNTTMYDSWIGSSILKLAFEHGGWGILAKGKNRIVLAFNKN